MPDLKLGRHKIRQFKREDIVLHLYQKEIEELATKACNRNRGGFKWINERSAIIENKFKCGTEDGFTEDEIRKIDNEVQQWNERELPASIQAKYIFYLFFFHRCLLFYLLDIVKILLMTLTNSWMTSAVLWVFKWFV